VCSEVGKMSGLATLRRVQKSGLVMNFSRDDARDLYDWTQLRADGLRTMRRYMRNEIKRMNLGLSADFSSFDTEEERVQFAHWREMAKQMVEFLYGVASGEQEDGKCYTIDMVMGYISYVNWMSSQHEFLMELQRVVMSEARRIKRENRDG